MTTAIGINEASENALAGPPSAKEAVEFHEGFGRVEALIRAVPTDDLEPVTLDIPSLCTTVIGAFPEIVALEGALEGLLSFDASHVPRLRDYALGLAHTHTGYKFAAGSSSNVAELAAECAATRDRLHDDAVAAAGRNLLDPAQVAKVQGGNAYRTIAFDVAGLVKLFLDRWPAIEGKTAVELSELEDARRKASALVTALGLREQAAPVPNEESTLRQQAYTLLVRSYNDTREAIAFVRRKEGDVDDIAPSLYAGRGRRAAVVEEVVPTQVVASKPEPVPALEVPVGFPGSSPLKAK